MSLPDALRTHTDLCEEIHGLMLEENRQLKGANRPPGGALLSRKRALLAALTPSLDRLRSAAAARQPATQETRACIEKAQQTILKALLLDRENEQLLLRSTLQPRTVAAEPRPTQTHIEKIYRSATV